MMTKHHKHRHSSRQRPAILPAEVAYDLAADFYDRRKWMRFWELNEKPRVFALLGKESGRAILDIGCGTGFYAVDLLFRGNKVYGVDLSWRMLERFRFKLEEVRPEIAQGAKLIRGDGTNLPITALTCDAAIVVRTLSHVENSLGLFGEAWRVLRPGGIFVVADLHSEHPYDHTSLEDPESGEEIGVITFKRHPETYVREAKETGFQLESYEEVSYGQCAWRPNGDFGKLRVRPELPIFFLAKFSK